MKTILNDRALLAGQVVRLKQFIETGSPETKTN